MELQLEVDFTRVLTKGPWFFKRGLFLSSWGPNFNMNTHRLNTALVWIRLPFQFWHNEIFLGMARAIEDPMAINSATRLKTMMVYAQLRVTMALDKESLHSIDPI